MKKAKRWGAICVLVCLLLQIGTAWAVGDTGPAKIEVGKTIQDTAAYVLRTVKEPTVGSIGGEWAVLALARSGYPVPQEYYEQYYVQVEKALEEAKGELHKNKYTEYSRVILALTAIGKDVTNVAGYNLLERLAHFDNVKKQGINGPIFALLALDAKQYEIPFIQGVTTQTTRDMLIDYILSKEITDEKGALGGFALGGNVPDPDITGMALQALAPYQNQEKVAQAIQRAIEVLSNLQENTGEYGSWGAKGAESTVQVIVGLSLLGIDCQTDQRFTKTDEAGKQHTPISAIMAYKASGGGFEHIKGQGINGMVTEQALYGLVAYERFQQGKTSLYDMTDVKGTVPAAPTATKAKESETANPTGQTADLAFTDIANHWAKDKIEALKGLGITNGQNTFAPDKAITRAEFAVALVNAFGLEKKDGAMVSFTDIPGNAWFQGAVLAAASQGIIKGKGNGLFEPQANITREEAMIMIQNIATTVYSMQNTTDEGVLLNEFADAGQISPWAKEAVVFNISQGIVVGEEQTINPSRPITRAEAMVMIDRLLDKLS